MEELNRVETDDEKRNLQYDRIIAWVRKNKENVLLRGTEIKKEPEQPATLITRSSDGYNNNTMSQRYGFNEGKSNAGKWKNDYNQSTAKPQAATENKTETSWG